MLPQVVTYLPGLRPLSTMELYTDTYYIQRIQAGDVACFACLLDKYSRPIHSLILKVVRSQEEAEELAQDTFMKVFKNLASFKGDCSFSTWIYRIVVNTSLDMLRRKKKETPTEEMPETPTEDHYQDLDLKQMINRLDDKSRTVIILRYFEDLKLEDIADIVGENLNTVKARLYRTLKKLRLELEPMPLGANQNHFSERSHAHETGRKQTDG